MAEPNEIHSDGITGSAEHRGPQHSAPPGQERLTYADGHERQVVTGESWRSGPGPVAADDLHDGQDINARHEDDAWLRPGFQDEG
ncbi:alpha-L-rhamnosidase N-terminal domain-containing protein [Streptomyces sp. NPDC005485]|uniref:alpha-L-rhamnosidase N-terminal domain-containing protein n=1 Tax=Streptomyces sp. NPDC005485 TaxID=3155591 RepID=UPI00339F0E0C